MGAPHNKKKYGQRWDEVTTAVMFFELIGLAGKLFPGVDENVTISGGWAWCLMSPVHIEYKHAHDLKDIDLFVNPTFLPEYVDVLYCLDYKREHTKYDNLSPFYRYSKMLTGIGCKEKGTIGIDKKIIIDLFVKEVPSIVVDGCRVVEPSYLASLYGKHDPDSRLHGSGQCWSLHNALELMENGEEVVNNPKMGEFSKWIYKK
jgi:hypothetical protein